MLSKAQAVALIRESPLNHLQDFAVPGDYFPQEFVAGNKLHLPIESLGDFLINSLEPSVHIHTRPLDPDQMTLGGSRFGGPADLPQGLAWPTWNAPSIESIDPRGRAQFGAPVETRLDLLAQINMAEVAAALPEAQISASGMLYFFSDLRCQEWYVFSKGTGCCRVIHSTAAADELQRQDLSPNAKHYAIKPAGLSFAHEYTLDGEIRLMGKYDFKGAFCDEYSCKEELLRQLRGEEKLTDQCHRLFGHPDMIQGDCRGFLQHLEEGYSLYLEYGDPRREAIEARSLDWKLLLQLDSAKIGAPGWMWGDVGRVFFFIKQDDLRAGRLERSRFHFESC